MKAISHGVRALGEWFQHPGVTLNVFSIVFGVVGFMTVVLGMFMMVEANQKMDIASFTQYTTSKQMLSMALQDVLADAPSRSIYDAMSTDGQRNVLEKTMRDLTAQFGNVALRHSQECLAAWNDLYGFTYVLLNGGLTNISSTERSDGFFDKRDELKKQCESVMSE